MHVFNFNKNNMPQRTIHVNVSVMSTHQILTHYYQTVFIIVYLRVQRQASVAACLRAATTGHTTLLQPLSTSLTLIPRHNNVMCPVSTIHYATWDFRIVLLIDLIIILKNQINYNIIFEKSRQSGTPLL